MIEYALSKDRSDMGRFFVFNCDAIHIVVTMKMFMGLFSFNKKHETILVVEMNSGGVAGAFFVREKGVAPLVLDTARREFPRRDVSDSARMKDDLMNALDGVIMELQKAFPGKPHRTYVILGAPWSSAELRTVEYQSEHDFRFTEKLGMKIISAEMKKLSKGDVSRTIMDHRTTEVLLNGYPVESPNGKLCRSAEVRCLFSFASAQFLSSIRDRVHRTYPSTLVFSSCMMSDFITIRDLSPEIRDMIILHVDAEITEVLLVGNGRLAGTATFPIGEQTLVRKAAEMMRKGVIETDSIFSLMFSNSLDESNLEKSGEVFSAVREIWQDALKEVLLELSPGRHIPHTVFFPSISMMNSYLCEGMKVSAFPEFTTGNLDFDAIITDMNMLHGFVSWKEGATRDPRIAMNTIFINRSLG